MMGILAQANLENTSDYSASRKHDTPKLPKEAPDDYESRTWLEKAHYNEEGFVVLPAMGFKFALMGAAAYLGEKVRGKGAKTWTQYFTSAVLIQDDIVLPYKREDLGKVTINAHAKGNRKDGTRVSRTFPLINKWSGILRCHIFDETITKDIFQRVVEHAGVFIGIGRFRPQNGGFNGRFILRKLEWQKAREAA